MAKLNICKHCGTTFSKKLKRCPNCNKRVWHPLRILLSIIITLVFLFVAFAIFIKLNTNY